jgi:ATP-dependent Clp protease ATP-binding subunit ClpC
MDPFATLLIVAVLACALGYALARLSAEKRPPHPPAAAEAPSELQQIVHSLGAPYQAASYPTEFLDHPDFRHGVMLLNDEPVSVETLLGYYTGDNALVACLGLEALARRRLEEDVRPRLLDHVNDYIPWTRFFVLRVLDAHTPQGAPVVGSLLARIDESWSFPINVRILKEFVQSRARGGEILALGQELDRMTEDAADALPGLLGRMPPELVSGLTTELNAWRARRIDREFLASIGRVWTSPTDDALETPILPHEALERHVSQVESAILPNPHRSVLLIGEHGVGKSAIVRSVARRMAEKGWVVFEAGHAELIAGMAYMGQLEERLKELLDRLNGRPVLWVVDDFHALLFAGRHQHGPLGALDFLLPHIERGEVVVLGETRPGAYERLVQSKPRVLTAMETYRIAPLSEKATLDLVDRWADSLSNEAGEPLLAPETRREAWMLAQQYLGDRAAPGNVLKLLEMTRVRVLAAEPDAAIGLDQLIATLGQLTGLPATVLDERQGLDLDALRELFQKRVLGQPEAVDCLVERVAMIKAGVTDPTCPLGVFLFAGPTGTGKTEIAKTLADFLFGSPERMIRLDMSEFQDPESLHRIVGEKQSEQQGGAMVDKIRKQPFSVILLDEFEKAHPNVWDLFLQVFDDGRLTDRLGNTADFRNAIVIMTSNLGSMIPSGAGLGFVDDTGRFSAPTVLREVQRYFRREFLNRVDRVIVFRPLARETMREILRKELAEAFHRRGLRNRAWAVEWDASALEFLLERGFTADLGARPLRRAIERHLLAPLATTIVKHQYPEGDQFLFVRAEKDAGLVVEFVDPDAPDSPPADGEPSLYQDEPSDDPLPLGRVALEPRGKPEEIAKLRTVYERLTETVEDSAWKQNKQNGLAETHSREFWHSRDRFRVLGNIEYLDRIEAGLRFAGSLLERLGGPRDRYPRKLVGRLAEQLYLLDAASRGVLEKQPREAFLLVEAWTESGLPSAAADAFARRIGKMYRAWASERRMQCEVLEEGGDDGHKPYRMLLALSGYAAYTIVAPEQGLHLLEIPDDEGKGFRRVASRVRVTPQPESPPGEGDAGLAGQARAALATESSAQLAIVRRYREKPSPLVRDTVRGWRTGRLDRVLGGHFDLLGAGEAR